VPRPGRFSDRIGELAAAERDLLRDLVRLEREEEYLKLKVRQARDQVRYYEGLLTLLHRDLGKAPGLSDLVRRLG
jgi:hypothetical protein